jgi:hypothetical protein
LHASLPVSISRTCVYHVLQANPTCCL